MELNVILFGATGHIGQGVLIECLEDPRISKVHVIGRKSIGKTHTKIQETIHSDFLDYSDIEDQLTGYDACFFCLGVSSVGLREDQYRRITYDYAMAAARVLVRLNPQMTFCFISGAGTDATLESRMMWARVKGQTENDLKTLPFKQVYLMRPAFIQPKKGVRTNYTMYKILGPLFPLLKSLMPKWVTTTEEVGQAMIHAVVSGYDTQTLENRDIIKLSGLR